MKRSFIAMLLLLALAACSPPQHYSSPEDSGIGGTGMKLE